MVLPTFVETKVGRAEGLSSNKMRTRHDSVKTQKIYCQNVFPASKKAFQVTSSLARSRATLSI